MHNTRIFITIRSRERHAFRKFDGAVARNFDLHAVGVELRTAFGVGGV
jgi:hypothetical protein